jgi:hypothetical protein
MEFTQIPRLDPTATYVVCIRAKLSGGRLGDASESVNCETVSQQHALALQMLDHSFNDPITLTTSHTVQDFNVRYDGQNSAVLRWKPPRRSDFLGYKVKQSDNN